MENTAQATSKLTHVVQVVFDVESYPPDPLGVLVSSGANITTYTDPRGIRRTAPTDCVMVVPVKVTVP